MFDPKPIVIRVLVDGRIEAQRRGPKVTFGEKIMRSMLERRSKEFGPVPPGTYRFIVKSKMFGLRGTEMTLEPIEL